MAGLWAADSVSAFSRIIDLDMRVRYNGDGVGPTKQPSGFIDPGPVSEMHSRRPSPQPYVVGPNLSQVT